MARFPRAILAGLAFMQLIGLGVRLGAQPVKLDVKTVRRGAHPWYEVKVDPENPRNLIICGTKLDPGADALFGFVYASGDGGESWRTAIEDTNSLWVTEQSCAFGPQHRAYFISEASKVIRGTPQHEQGTTRLYVSTDGGQSWTETAKTGWADYSTSVVSAKSSELYTFFNTIAGDPGRTWGSNVGVLVFSKDGKSVAGPFFDPNLQNLGYDGTFPSGAVTLNSGNIATLYYGTKTNGSEPEADLGILRVEPSQKPTLEHNLILHTVSARDCLQLDNSLAYDQRSNRMFLAYVEGCRQHRIILLSSDDEGRTWSDRTVLGSYEFSDHPSLVFASDGSLGLLWEKGEGSGQWLFSTIEKQQLLEPAIELSPFVESTHVNQDSLLTWVYQANERHGGRPAEPSITLNVVNMLNITWRSSGAVLVGDKVLVVWAAGDASGTKLYSALLETPRIQGPRVRGRPTAQESDVTEEALILYGGIEHFDPDSGNLDLCLMVGNSGSRMLRAPIRLEAAEISSPIGSVTITNATNKKAGTGAFWDISDALTGNQLAPREVSNSFCLSFHVTIPSAKTHSLEPDDLVMLKLKVLASTERL
jgi:hypothetical protein